MQDTIEQATRQLRKVYRGRWIIVFTAMIVCAAGWETVSLIPDQYESKTRLYFTAQSALDPVLRGLAVDSTSPTPGSGAAMRTLLTRANLETVIREADLDMHVTSETGLERMVQKIHKDITVRESTPRNQGRGNANVTFEYEISYIHQDAKTAKKVVETLLNLFIEQKLRTSRKEASSTEEFLNKQIMKYESKLELAEERLKEFKRKNIGLMPTEAGDYFANLRVTTTTLEEAKLELQEAQQRRDELQNQINKEMASLQRMGAEGSITDADITLNERINALEVRLDDLLLQYTEQHPDVISIKRTIQELEDSRGTNNNADAASEEHAVSSMQQGGQQSPVYQELTVSFGEAEAEVSALLVRVAEYEDRAAKYQSMAETIPKVEAELARLNRDYDVNRQNYESLVSRREASKISNEADRSIDEEKFTIVEPPVVPLVPVSPNRLLLLTAVLLLGLGGGIVLAWLWGQIRATIDNTKELSDVTGYPVFGSVSEILTKQQITRNRIGNGLFVVFIIALLISYFAVVVTQVFDVDSVGEVRMMLAGGEEEE